MCTLLCGLIALEGVSVYIHVDILYLPLGVSASLVSIP